MKNTYYYFIILVIACLSCKYTYSQVTYWEDLCFDEQMKIISDSNTYKGAVDFYYGKFNIDNTTLTVEMLDQITGTDNFNPLYFHIINRIITSPGVYTIKIMPFNHSYKFFMRYPNEVIGYSPKDSLGNPTNFSVWYAIDIGYSLYFNHDKTDKEEKLKSVEEILEKFRGFSEEYKKRTDRFLKYLHMFSNSDLVE
jgi:hypothetical protein